METTIIFNSFGIYYFYDARNEALRSYGAWGIRLGIGRGAFLLGHVSRSHKTATPIKATTHLKIECTASMPKAQHPSVLMGF